MAGMDLTPKQEAFVQEYLIDLNATQAAIRAGYSEKTANEQGSRLLANVKIAKAIAEAKAGNGDDNEPLEYTSKIKTWDKPSALDKLGRHLGLYAPEKIAVTVEAEVSPSDKLTGFLNAVASRKSS